MALTDAPAFARLLADCERPVFVAGRGARAAGPQLRRLADYAGALLATSAVANGLFHDDPFDLGISGGFASPTSAALIAARVDRLVFGATDDKAGAVGGHWDVVRDPRLNHRIEVVPLVLAADSAELLRSFFAEHRQPG